MWKINITPQKKKRRGENKDCIFTQKGKGGEKSGTWKINIPKQKEREEKKIPTPRGKEGKKGMWKVDITPKEKKERGENDSVWRLEIYRKRKRRKKMKWQRVKTGNLPYKKKEKKKACEKWISHHRK